MLPTCQASLSNLHGHIKLYVYVYHHIPQPLDVGTLKQNYKKLLSEKTRFTTYNIDKADFISLVQKARRQVITSRNIQ